MPLLPPPTSNDVPGVNDTRFSFRAWRSLVWSGSRVSLDAKANSSCPSNLSRLIFWRAMSLFEQM